MFEKIAPFHLAILIYMIQSGVTFFKLPRMLAVNFGTNGWLMVVIVSFIVMINLLLISLVIRFRVGENVFEIMEGLISVKWMAPFYLLLALTWSLLSILVGKDFISITQVLSFQNTNSTSLFVILMVLVFYLGMKDIYTISKATNIFFILTIGIFFLIIYHIPYTSLERLTPFIFKEGKNTIEGIVQLYTAFLGFEIVLFLFPYVDQSKPKWFRSVYYGHFLTTVVYSVTCFVSYLFFSLNQLKITSYPVLNLIAYIEIELIERIETFVFNLFLIKILVTLVLYLWASSLLLERVIPALSRKQSVAILIITSMLITLNVDVMSEIADWLLVVGFVAAALAIGLPIILLIVIGIRTYRGDHRA
ncbi:GerAB/ArcD/ProY family transporter [Pseudalkalibacillus hwajinpoensis]|uniref:Spore gernimation protein n=1 Tax=Guptibacillus hwajinpoensis TaxID=208199 RepID=A0A4U1MN44_9BACL|nr:GerAB/ArcD/ProY family transporter [Pseudalkalibacillus hwajinpoensis]TKD72012.1 spore gernimation protein [Pseudalkalibacillus hwajinpoensis]